MRSWKNLPFIVEKILEAVSLVPDLKTMVKWTLVLIYGRLYITDYSQGKIIFEIQMRTLSNEVPGEIFTYSSFSRSVKKEWVTSGFGLKLMLGGYLFASVHCILKLSCEIRYKIA